MYCPKCRAEYVEGISECPECGVSLVAELPSKEKHTDLRALKVATMLALIGICYNFAVRTISTFWQEIFRIRAVASSAQIGFLLSSVFLAFFFVSFFKEHDPVIWRKLRRATGWAIAAAVLMILINLKRTLAVFVAYMSPQLHELVISSQIAEVLFPWIASLFMLYFFIVFYKEMAIRDIIALKRATLAGVAGSLLGAMHMTFVFWSYLISTDSEWFYKFSGTFIWIFLPIVSISFLLTTYFYIKFYRFLAIRSTS